MDTSEMIDANLELWGESIVVDEGSGVTRTIRAIVQRNPPAPTGESPKVQRLQFRVIVKNHATTGLSAATFNTGAHKLRIPRRVGGTAESWGGWVITEQTESGLVLEK